MCMTWILLPFANKLQTSRILYLNPSHASLNKEPPEDNCLERFIIDTISSNVQSVMGLTVILPKSYLEILTPHIAVRDLIWK